MKYQNKIKSIKKSIEKNKLQEAVKKMYSLADKLENEGIEMYDCMCGQLVVRDTIKAFISDSDSYISQYKGDINNVENLNNDTYYDMTWLDDEIIVHYLTKNALYEVIFEIDEFVYDKFLDKINNSENTIIRFFNKNIEVLKNELSEKYKSINKNFENKFGLNFEEFVNWAYDTDNEKMIEIVQ